MATSSTNQPLGPRYGLGRPNPPTTQNPYGTPAAGFTSNAKNQQRLDSERLERERRLREERDKMEAAGQNSLAELSEEQREEISEAVSAHRPPPTACLPACMPACEHELMFRPHPVQPL